MTLKIDSIKLFFLGLAFSINTVHAQPEGGFIASLNGGHCNFSTIADAIASAQSGDVVNIRGGTHFESIGEISIDLTLVASSGVTGCESGTNASVTIDGMGQTFDATGGLVKVTNGATVTFLDMALRNASAANGGVLAVVQGSVVTLDHSDVYAGSALSAGGNVYVSDSSSLTLNNGSTIYDGTVISGNGGGIALFNARFQINDGFIGITDLPGNSASNNGGAIYAETSHLKINGLGSLIQNNQSENSGGGIYVVDSTVEINDAMIAENTTQNNGGGIYLDNSRLTLTNARISFNQTTVQDTNQGGGGLYVDESSSAIIDSSNFISNVSEFLGGGILSVGNSASVRITNGSDILNNSADIGGGVFTNSALTVDLSRISFNSASSVGGGIRCHTCQNLSILNSTQISNNTASSNGGGLAIFSIGSTDVVIRNSSLTGNSLTHPSSSNGGGVSQDGGTIVIDTSTISSNSARNNGGGVNLFSLDSARISGSTFFNNSTSAGSDSNNGGAALFIREVFDAQITNSEFNQNVSGHYGGAIFLYESNLILDHSTVTENSTNQGGGGIHIQEGDLEIKNSMIAQNTATASTASLPGILGGGGISAVNSDLDLINTKVNHNTSNDLGGGIYYRSFSDNSLTIKSDYGVSSEQCLPSALEFNEYCSEISYNSATIGAGLTVSSSSSEQEVSIKNVAINANVAKSFFGDVYPGVGMRLIISNSPGSQVTLENIIAVENDGINAGNSIFQFTGDITLNLLSSTISNNLGSPIQAEDEDSTIIVQGSIIHQNTTGPFVANGVPFISLCNNSQSPFVGGGQSFGTSLGDPIFIPTARGDYRLSEVSPSIDTCTTGSLNDLDGNDRPNGVTRYDQGAFEMNAEFITDRIFKNGFE